MKIQNSFTLDFKVVKQRVSFRDVLDHYQLLESLTGSENSLRGECPICGGDNDSKFSVNLEKNCYNCFGGCSKGNVLDFVMAMEDCPVKEAAKKLTEWFDLEFGSEETDSKRKKSFQSENKKPSKPERKSSPSREHSEKEDSKKPKPAFNKPLGFALQFDHVHPYPEERGLSEETIESFGMGYCERGILKDRIAIPLHNVQGEIVAYIGRQIEGGTDPKYHIPAGFQKGLELFNLHRVLERLGDQPLLIVEGVFPCMWLHQLGYAVVSTMGSTLTDGQFDLIREHTRPGMRFIILYDEDEAGQRGREKAALKLATHGFVHAVTLPEEGMQPDDLTDEAITELLSLFIDPQYSQKEVSHAY